MCGGDTVDNPCSNARMSRTHVTCISLSAASRVLMALLSPCNHADSLIIICFRSASKSSSGVPSNSRGRGGRESE